MEALQPKTPSCVAASTWDLSKHNKANKQTQRLADEQQMSAVSYADASWNWGARGPWPSGFGFGYRGGRGR